MHHAKRSSLKQRRLPAEQVDNDPIKRQAGAAGAGNAGAFALTAPITLTVVQVNQGSTAVQRPLTSSTALANTRPATTQQNTAAAIDAASQLPATTRAIPTPVVSVKSVAPSSIKPVEELSTSHKAVPAGAIGGAVIGIIAFLILVAVVLLRRRFIFNRQKKRNTWTKPGKGPISSQDYVQRGYNSGIPNDSEKVPYSGPYGGGNYNGGNYNGGNYNGGNSVNGDNMSGFRMITPMTAAAALAVSKQSDPMRLGVAGISPINTSPSMSPLPNPYPATPSTAAQTTMSSPITPATGLSNAATVKSTFIPTLPDELPISVGEIVAVTAEYDDGWTLCKNVLGQQGMVPSECLKRGVVAIPGLNGIPSNGFGASTVSLAPSGQGIKRMSSLPPSFMKM